MAVFDTTPLQPDFIKLRWLEPFVSSGLNRKTFKSLPRGVYSGWIVSPGPGSAEVQINHDDPDGFGLVSGFSGGAFDVASSGWSVAVHASLQGFTSTVAVISAPGGANDFTFDLTARRGETVYIAIEVDYKTGFETTGNVKVVDDSELDADPTLLNLARVDVPLVGAITSANIVPDDPAYPRVLPFATRFKFGFMDKFQASLLEDLASVSGAEAALLHEELAVSAGSPQTFMLPSGFLYTVGGDDLWVFKNGSYKRVGVDYDEVDRGDGRGEDVSYTGTLKAGDRLLFRVQATSSVLTSTTQILDEMSLITDNAIFINFSGAGVSVFPDGANRVNIVIPGGGGGASAIRTKFNDSGLTIGIFKAVTLVPDNTIRAYDPAVSGDELYGITLQEIADSVAGDISIAGLVNGAADGVSAGLIGDDVFVSDDGAGGLTVTPPDPFSARVIRVGLLDGPNTAVTGVASDIVFDRGRLT